MWNQIFLPSGHEYHNHYVVMGTMASQMTSLTIVYSTVYSGADQRRHQSSVSLAFVWGIHRWPVNSLHKWPVTWKMFCLMMSSCKLDRRPLYEIACNSDFGWWCLVHWLSCHEKSLQKTGKVSLSLKRWKSYVEPLSISILCIHGLVQERHNSIANALELCLSCTNTPIYGIT